MQHLHDHYTHKIQQLEIENQRFRTINTLIVFAKLLSIVLLVLFVYLWLANDFDAGIYLAVVSLFLFVTIQKFDSKFLKKRAINKQLRHLMELERGAIDGNYSHFDNGKEFEASSHPYAVDLDLFAPGGLFAMLNRTVTLEGRQALAQWLLSTKVDKDVIVARQNATKHLAALTDWRLKFLAIGSLNRLSMSGLVNYFSTARQIHMPSWSKYIIYAWGSMVGLSFMANLFGLVGTGLWLSLFILNLLIVAFWLNRTNKVYKCLQGSSKIAESYRDLLLHIKTHEASVTDGYTKELIRTLVSSPRNSLEAFTSLEKILASFDRRGNVLISLTINGFFLNDLLLVLRYNKWVEVYGTKLAEYQHAIAQLDALVSLSNFAFNHPSFTFPVVSEQGVLKAESLGHPLIGEHERVTNDFELDSLRLFYITTGANMAGKSTFLRTVGVNMVLAACGAPVCANYFSFRPMCLFSSMRTTDNLEKHVSYFQAELLRLKSLFELARSGEPVFVILDEILKGTNSKDKLEGSRTLLQKLLQFSVSGLVATHDLLLGDMQNDQPDHFRNICFEVYIRHDQLDFNYKLQPGIAQNMNATWLIHKMFI